MDRCGPAETGVPSVRMKVFGAAPDGVQQRRRIGRTASVSVRRITKLNDE